MYLRVDGPGWRFYLTPIADGKLHWRTFNTILSKGEGGRLSGVQAFLLQEPTAIVLEKQ